MAKAKKGDDAGGLTKMLTSNKALRVVPLDKLQVDPAYQRGVRPKHKQIVQQFNEDALGVLLIGQRSDSSLWVVDGLQRMTALRILGWKEVRADVFASSGQQHEAAVFQLVNGGRVRLSGAELFRAKLTAGEVDAADIKRAVEAAGFRLSFHGRTKADDSNTAWKQTTSLGTLERVLYFGGVRSPERITRVFDAVARAWPGDMLCGTSDLLGGVGQFFTNMGDDKVDDDRLASRLALTTPQKLLHTASLGIGGRHANVADAVAKLYARHTGPRKRVV